MDTRFTSSDKKILILFYVIGIIVTMYDGYVNDNGWIEIILDTIIF